MSILKEKSIVLNKDIKSQVIETGQSVNAILENQFRDELAEIRKDARFQNKSATKIAILDADIRGNMKVENLFRTNGNEYLFAPYMADLIETTMIESDIMSYLVSGEMEIDATVIKAPTLDLMSEENKKQLKKARVAEGGQFPIREITIGDTTASLFKKGVQLKQTYEAARRTNIDLFSKTLNAILGDVVHQNVAEATRVLESSKLYTVGTTAGANVITNDELLDYIFEYVDRFGYAPTTILAPKDMFKPLYKMFYNVNEVYGMSQKLKLNFPTVQVTDINVIPADVKAVSGKNQCLMYNKDYSLTRYVERGSTLQESGNNIENQTNNVVLSEVSGFANFVESVGVIKSA